MNAPARITIFGALSGLIWSIVAGFISGLFKSRSEVITVLVAGVLTGILVSFVLSRPLRRLSRWGSLWLGILALPLGAFCFGVVISFVHLAASHITGVEHVFTQSPVAPLTRGISFAVLSVVSIFAVVLFPLSVFTTFVFREFILRRSRHENTAS